MCAGSGTVWENPTRGIPVFNPNLQSRQQILESGKNGLARNAAACAIRSGHFSRAVEFLEEGRTIFWSQALQLRTPLDKLPLEAPDLAQKLKDISQSLEQGSLRYNRRDTFNTEKNVISIEQEAVHYRKLGDDWLVTLQEV